MADVFRYGTGWSSGTARPLTREYVEGQIQQGHRWWHRGGCRLIVGPRGALTIETFEYRVSGKLRTWKRDTERFELPLKHGMYGPSYTLTEHTSSDIWHSSGMCAVQVAAWQVSGILHQHKGLMRERRAEAIAFLESCEHLYR